MLHIRGLTRSGVTPFDLTLERGECVALQGPSGAGKTLLLRAIADLDPSHGDVSLDQTDRDSMPPPQWRQRVCYLAPESGWWSDDVGAHFPEPDRAKSLFTALNLSPDALGWRISRLSTGERQRLALARVLLLEPDVMLLDEPTSGLDGDTVLAVENILRDRLTGGTAILLVTHADDQAQRLGGRCLVMEAGTLRESPA